jgi:hypothetical protein
MQYVNSDSSPLVKLRQLLVDRVINGLVANFLDSESRWKFGFEAQTLKLTQENQLFAPEIEKRTAALVAFTAGFLAKFYVRLHVKKTELVYLVCRGSCAVLRD